MMTGTHLRMFRPNPVTAGMRQHVSVRTDWVVSKRMARLVALILCLSLIIVFAFSQLMHKHISSTVNRLDTLRSARTQFSSENIALLAKKAQLTSKEYITDLAGKRYHLHLPDQGQIRRL